MQGLEVKLDGDRLFFRHPGGVAVMLDFSAVDAGGAPGAAQICGVRIAAKPTPEASRGGKGTTKPTSAARPRGK